MNWREQMSRYEMQFGTHAAIDCGAAIELIQTIVRAHRLDAEAYVRTIYFLHNILVEEKYSEQEGAQMEALLQEYFHQSYDQFQNSAEYLFFIGRILHIAEWYFGIDEAMKPVDQTLAFRLQRKAAFLEPDNTLYAWGWLFSIGDETAALLASNLLSSPSTMEWLKSKGYPGQYTTEALIFSAGWGSGW